MNTHYSISKVGLTTVWWLPIRSNLQIIVKPSFKPVMLNRFCNLFWLCSRGGQNHWNASCEWTISRSKTPIPSANCTLSLQIGTTRQMSVGNIWHVGHIAHIARFARFVTLSQRIARQHCDAVYLFQPFSAAQLKVFPGILLAHRNTFSCQALDTVRSCRKCVNW